MKLDITAPVAMLADPVNPNWQQGPATLNFTGTDVGSGYAFTEWSTDGGVTVNQGEVAQIGGDGVITVNYRGVDNVGIRSAWTPTEVKVATTAPTVQGANATVKRGQKARFNFTVTAVTPTVRLVIQIRRMSGQTLSTHTYENVADRRQDVEAVQGQPQEGPLLHPHQCRRSGWQHPVDEGQGHSYGQVIHDRLHSRRQLQWAGRRKAPRPFLRPASGSRARARVRWVRVKPRARQGPSAGARLVFAGSGR